MRLVAPQESTIQILQSSLFDPFPNLVHGFSTRHGGVSRGLLASLNLGAVDVDSSANVAQNRKIFFGSLNIAPDRVAQGHQIHGSTVSVVSVPQLVPGCDALITNRKGLYLAIKIADCFALLIYDAVRQVVAAVHAGWRGIHHGVIQNTIHKMQLEFGTQVKDLYIAVGPGAQGCCYEVQSDVAALFSTEFTESRDGRLYLDLESVIASVLTDLKIPGENRDNAHRCTVCEKEHFYSYRRDGKQSGRMVAVIGMRGNENES